MTARACVYILASKPRGTLYTGATSNLPLRMEQHRSRAVPGFTAKYGVTRLVWFETYADIRDAISREKALKKWYRAWKIELIEKSNPVWNELHPW